MPLKVANERAPLKTAQWEALVEELSNLLSVRELSKNLCYIHTQQGNVSYISLIQKELLSLFVF